MNVRIARRKKKMEINIREMSDYTADLYQIKD